MRLARAVAIAVLVMLVAVTPLSALIAPGEFDVRLARYGSSDPGFIVHLSDRTRLVRGLAVAPPRRGVNEEITNYGTDGRFLIVSFFGSSCDYLAHLTFERTGAGMVIRTTTQGSWCLGTGRYIAVALHLWTPIDASTVEFDPPH